MIAGCGGEARQATTKKTASPVPKEKPDDFLKRLLEYNLRGEFGLEYDAIHPAHQALISRKDFVQCWQHIGTPLPRGATLTSLEIVDLLDEPFSSVGIDRTPSKTVTWRTTFHYEGNFNNGRPMFDYERIDHGRGFTNRSTGTIVAVDGEWRWVVGWDFARLFESGECLRPR